MFGTRIMEIDWGIYQALTIIIGAFVSVYLTSFIVDALAPSFQSEKNFNRSVQLVAYSLTPAWIGGLFALIPAIAFIGSLFGLYSLYLLYIGLPKLKKTPIDKQTGYFVVSLVVCIIVYMVVGWILGGILMRSFGLSYEILVYNRDLLRSSSLRNCAVKLAFTFTRSSGVPSNKIIPPPSPPSGPKSII
jgi:hypothetical protein